MNSAFQYVPILIEAKAFGLLIAISRQRDFCVLASSSYDRGVIEQ